MGGEISITGMIMAVEMIKAAQQQDQLAVKLIEGASVSAGNAFPDVSKSGDVDPGTKGLVIDIRV